MELPGSTYLYTLATLAMMFAGFYAIIIGLRQTIGKPVSGFHHAVRAQTWSGAKSNNV